MPYPSSSLYPSSIVFPGPSGGGGGTIVVVGGGGDITSLPVLPAPVPLVLQDRNGNVVAGLEVAHTIRFEVNAAASITFPFGFDENGANELLDMLTSVTPRIQAYRNNDLIFSGWWMPQTDSLDGSGGDGMTCEFRSPFARLETRYLSVTQNYANGGPGTDAGAIAWDLINKTNAEGATGLTIGQVEATVNLDRTYKPGQQISDAIVSDLVVVKNSFSFTETPLEASTGNMALFNAWSDLGRDLTDTVKFEYGENTLANVLSVSRTWSPPVNRAIALGGTSTVPAVVDDADSQASYGLYTNTIDFSSTVNKQTQLNQLAQKMLQPDAIQEVAFDPDIDAGISPIDDYWLGDTISFRAVQDGLTIEATPQITAIEIDRDGDGQELAHRLEFGPAVVDPLVAERVRNRVRFRHQRRTGGSKAHHHSHRGHPNWHNPFSTKGPVIPTAALHLTKKK